MPVSRRRAGQGDRVLQRRGDGAERDGGRDGVVDAARGHRGRGRDLGDAVGGDRAEVVEAVGVAAVAVLNVHENGGAAGGHACTQPPVPACTRTGPRLTPLPLPSSVVRGERDRAVERRAGIGHRGGRRRVVDAAVVDRGGDRLVAGDVGGDRAQVVEPVGERGGVPGAGDRRGRLSADVRPRAGRRAVLERRRSRGRSRCRPRCRRR